MTPLPRRSLLCLLAALGSLTGTARAASPARAPAAPGSTVVSMARAAAEVVSPHAIAVDARTGRVFATAYDSGLKVLNAATGRILRTIAVSPSAGGVAVDGRTGRVFVANWGHSFLAQGSVSTLDEASDAVLRTVAVGTNPRVMTVDEAAGRLFVTNLYSVSVLDARTGALLRTIPMDGASFSPVAVDPQTGRAFAITYDTNVLGRPVLGANYVGVLDAASGALLSRVPDMHVPFMVAVDRRTGRVFVGNTDGTVAILDARTGRLIRTVSLVRRSFCNGMAVDEQASRVVVSSYSFPQFSGHVSVLDARSGALIRTSAVGTAPSAVAVDGLTGRAFVTSFGGVSVLDVRSGRVVRTVKAGSSLSSLAVDERLGRVYASSDAALSILDARNGTLLHTTMLARLPAP